MQFQYKTQKTIDMRFIIATLFCISLFHLSACSNIPKSDQAIVSNSEEVPPSIDSRSSLETPIEKIEEKEKETIPPEVLKQNEKIVTAQPKVVKASDKRVINESPQPSPQVPEKTTTVQEMETTVPPVSIKEAGKASVSEKPAATIKEIDNALTSSSQGKGISGKPDHRIWDELLQKYVTSAGKVNYAGLKSESSRLQAYLDQLKVNPIESNWTRSEKMAYWINAYNAFTIQLILNNHPMSSITKLHGGKPWDVKWIKLGNKTYSLNQIENDILRPQYKDARIHFAVNCAAKSCPPLLNRAWTGDNLNAFLDKQTKSFINNSTYNTITAKQLTVSKIFEWYAADFGNLIEFLNKYSKTNIHKSATITYQEYDWALNN